MANNFTGENPSIDKALAASATYGNFARCFFAMVNNTTTAATVTSGYTTAQKFDISPIIPVVGSVQGFIATNISAFTEDSNTIMIVGIEYLLGTLNFSGNVFTLGSQMPIKSVRGTPIQTASGLTMLTVRNTLVATNPTITFSYTNQVGNVSNTNTITLPSNSAANSAFLLQPNLPSDSYGIRTITNMSRNTGTSGIVDIYGILPLYFSHRNIALYETNILTNFSIPWLLQPGDRLGFYRLLSNTTCDACISINLIPEPI